MSYLFLLQLTDSEDSFEFLLQLLLYLNSACIPTTLMWFRLWKCLHICARFRETGWLWFRASWLCPSPYFFLFGETHIASTYCIQCFQDSWKPFFFKYDKLRSNLRSVCVGRNPVSNTLVFTSRNCWKNDKLNGLRWPKNFFDQIVSNSSDSDPRCEANILIRQQNLAPMEVFYLQNVDV